MSLHDSASQVQSAGRGDDKVLVHMTPNEVHGLQALAMAHGGSLTINPATGLPEAGFLSSLLPMAIGFGLAPLTGGLSAALITGAGYTAATGSLKKGIMAGLGAYSGAGLAGGLNAMGAQASQGAGIGVNAANAGKEIGVNLANAGTGMGAQVPSNMLANTAGVVDDVTLANLNSFGPNASIGLNTNYTSLTPQLNAMSNSSALVSPTADPFAYAKQTNQNFVDTVTKNQAMKTTPIRGAGSQRLYTQDIYGTAPKVDARLTSDVSSGAFKGRPTVSTIESTDFVPVEVNVMPPAPVPVTRGLSGAAPEGQVFDRALVRPGAGANYPTVIAKPSVDSSTDLIPIVNRSGMQTVIEKPVVRSEILTGDPALANPRSLSGPYRDYMSQVGRGAKTVYEGGMQGLKDLYAASEAAAPYSGLAGLGSTAYNMYDEKRREMEEEMRARAEANRGLIRPYTFDYGTSSVSAQPYYGSAERTYFQPTYTELPSYKAPGPEYAAKGGLMGLAVGGPVEQMAAMNSVGANTGYPMASINTPVYSNPMMQRPEAMNVIAPSADAGVGAYTGEARFARGGGTAEPESSGYTYDYNPQTMQFTQTAGPGARPSDKDLALGVGAQDMHRRFVESQITGQPMNFTPSWAQSSATPNGPVNGGVATPMMQPTAPAQSFVPNINIPAYQTPEQQLGLGGFYDYMNQQLGGYSGYAGGGGVSHLGDYSDGGRLLKGPGDGVSDSIPASIGNRQPARLADGEFVVPARIVSEIGNGSTEAGARKLYAMMDRVQKARRKTVGKGQVARNTKAEKLLPA